MSSQLLERTVECPDNELLNSTSLHFVSQLQQQQEEREEVPDPGSGSRNPVCGYQVGG